MSKDDQIKVTIKAKAIPLPEAIAEKMCEISQGLPDPGGKAACALRALAEDVRGLQGACPPHVWIKRDEMPMGGAAWQVTCDSRARDEKGMGNEDVRR